MLSSNVAAWTEPELPHAPGSSISARAWLSVRVSPTIARTPVAYETLLMAAALAIAELALPDPHRSI